MWSKNFILKFPYKKLPHLSLSIIPMKTFRSILGEHESLNSWKDQKNYLLEFWQKCLSE